MITGSIITEVSRCETNYDLWGIIFFLLGIIGLLIYCLVKERKLFEDGIKLRKDLYNYKEVKKNGRTKKF